MQLDHLIFLRIKHIKKKNGAKKKETYCFGFQENV